MKRVLFVITSHDTLGQTGRPTGWYLPEVSHVWAPLIDAGYAVDFTSPQGGAAPMDPGSLKREDPLNARFLDEAVGQTTNTLRPSEVDPSRYAAIYYAGGHGTMWDFPNHADLARVASAIHAQGGVVAAVCHGPAGLVGVTQADGRPLVAGKVVTAFSDAEEAAVGLTGVVPFLLESTLRSLGADVRPGPKWSDTVHEDGRLITGQNPQSAHHLGQRLVAALSAAS